MERLELDQHKTDQINDPVGCNDKSPLCCCHSCQLVLKYTGSFDGAAQQWKCLKTKQNKFQSDSGEQMCLTVRDFTAAS